MWIAWEKERQRMQDEMRWLLDSIEEIMVLKPKLDEVKDWGRYDTAKLLRLEAGYRLSQVSPQRCQPQGSI